MFIDDSPEVELSSPEAQLIRSMLQCQLDSLTNLLVTHKHLVATTYGQGLTPLMYAARGSLLGCVERLLEHGADVNAVDRQGCSALYMAAELGREAVARLLLAHQADLTTPTRNGSTVLMGATVTCGPALVSHILARVDTAHVNRCNRYGDSALALACHYGKMTEAKLLLWAGADPAAGPGGGPRKIAMMGHGINPRAVLELFQWWEGEQTRFEVLAKARCVSHFQAHPSPEAIAKLPPFLQQRAQARHPLPTLAAVAPPPPSAESTPTQKGKRPRSDVAEEEAEDIGELRATADFVATRLCPQLFVELRRALVPQHMWDGPGPADERY